MPLALTVMSRASSGTVSARGKIDGPGLFTFGLSSREISLVSSVSGIFLEDSGANLRLARSACIASIPAVPDAGAVKTSSNGLGAGAGGEVTLDDWRFRLDSRSIKIGDSGRGIRAGDVGKALVSDCGEEVVLGSDARGFLGGDVGLELLGISLDELA